MRASGSLDSLSRAERRVRELMRMGAAISPASAAGFGSNLFVSGEKRHDDASFAERRGLRSALAAGCCAEKAHARHV